MEEKIVIEAGDNLESAVYTLLAEKARGKHVYCIFNGHTLHSDTVTMDSAYIELFGCTKEEFDKLHDANNKLRELKENLRKEREQEYKKMVLLDRSKNNTPITPMIVINGIKYIAEHQSLDQIDLINGLLNLGCNFSLEDIKAQFPNSNVKLYEGIKNGNIPTGAEIIVNVRDSENDRSFCNEKFLSCDDEYSIYNFIRVTTGDKTYTKENVDYLNEANNKQK